MEDAAGEGGSMPAVVDRRDGGGWRLEGSWADAEVADRFLAHLVARAFSPATVRAYAYDLVNFGRFCVERGVRISDAVPIDFLDYLDWQACPRPAPGGKVVPLAAHRGPAAATMNRRVAAVRRILQKNDDVADLGGPGRWLADAPRRVDAGGDRACGRQDELDLSFDSAVSRLSNGLRHAQPHECAHECLHHGDAKKHTIAQRCN